jgi:hypothetical protein
VSLFREEKPWLALADSATQDEVARLFDRTRVLVEVDCPGAASDYYLFDEKEELDQLIRGLPPNTRIFLTSVVDLRNRKSALRVTT